MDLKRQYLNLSDPERADAWFTAFAARGRSKKLKDDVKENDLQLTDLFLTLCGEDALVKLGRLVKPAKLHNLPFSEIEAKARELVDPKKKLLIAERTNFLAIQKMPDETSDDLHIRINHAADRCEFENFKKEEDPVDELKKMVFINSFTDRRICKELLDYIRQTKGVTYEDLRERVRQFNQASAFLNRPTPADQPTLQPTPTPPPHEDINHLKSQTGKKSCTNCGGQHPPRRCPAYGKDCKNCGKQGHYAKLCRSPAAAEANYVSRGQTCESLDLADSYFVCNASDTINNADAIIEVVIIHGLDVPMQHDTGASCTILSSHLWEKIGSPDLHASQRKLTSYDDRGFDVLGECKLDIIRNHQSSSVVVQVVKSSRHYGLFGRDILLASSVHSVEKISAEYLPVVRGVVATMKLKENSFPKFCQARPVPLPLHAAATEELERLQAMGVIEPAAAGGTENASPVVWVKKPSGSLRMCVDFSVHVNDKILSDAYPIPNIESIFSNLTGAKCFAKFDLKSAYWQIAIDDVAQNLSVINTHKGLFRVKRLQMGMKNSAAIFQQVIEHVLQGIKGVIPYQDDVLIHAANADSLNKRVNAVLERFKQRRLSINKSKCLQQVSEITFLGFRVSANGIGPDDRLVEKVSAIDTPRNKKDVSSFVGLVNFFGRLIPNFAGKLAPLNALRKDDTPFQWTTAAQQAFESLKRELACKPLVQPYSLTKPVTLTTDASGTAIAGIMTQDGHPVMYVSKTLTRAESNYSATEREALAIVWCVERLRQFLLGRRFTLITDHQALLFLFGENKPIPKTASARVSRWAIKLMAFDFDLQHHPGVSIAHADALSRLSQTIVTREDVVASIATATDSAFFSPVLDTAIVKSALASDPLATSVTRRVVSGNWSHVSQAEKPFARVRDELTVENAMLYYKSVPFIPQKLRHAVLTTAHRTHQGVNTTIRFLLQGAWWPGIFRDVDAFVSKCQKCAEIRPRLGHTVHTWPIAAPWERLHMDFAQIRDVGLIFIVADAGSGWIEAFRCPDRSTPTVIRILAQLFSRFGIPKTLVSDNAKEFINDEVVKWLSNSGCNKIESPIYFPRANGLAERAVQTVKKAMMAWHTGLRVSFDMFLNRILTVHRATSLARGRSPAEILLGRNLRVPFIADFAIGDTIMYKQSPSRPVQEAEYVIAKGNNTAWITADGNTILASRNQIAPSPPASDLPADKAPMAKGCGAPSVEPSQPVDDVVIPRRSSRVASAPLRYGFS